MSKIAEAAADHELLQAGVERGYLSAAQVEFILKRQSDLRRSGLEITAAQALLERRYLTSASLSALLAELQKRRQAQAGETAPQPEAPLRAFGQYEVLAVLSDKGHSRVLKARDTTLNRTVVLKVLPKNLAADPQWAERFRREAQLAGQLSHPNIITTFGAGEAEGCPLLAFEYLDGVSLGDRLEREGNVPERTAWQIAREVAKGLAFAAGKGVVHRDIKPDNVLCSRTGEVKIIDMGFSKSMADDSALTAAGTTVGTPFYISPEQARGTKELDSRTDIYGLGCTVFHMLTGSVPFLGESLMEVMVKHTEAPRPDPRSLLPEISEGSVKLVMRMMALKLEDRPPSMAALIAEIDALLPTLPEPEYLVRPAVKVVRSAATASGKDGAQAPPPKPPPRVPKPSFFSRVLDWLVALLD